MEEHLCCESVFDSWSWEPCKKPAKFCRNGKWYCEEHDPIEIRKRAIEHNIEKELIDKYEKIRTNSDEFRNFMLKVLEEQDKIKRKLDKIIQFILTGDHNGDNS